MRHFVAFALAMASALLLSGVSQAQTEDALESVIVTATRTPEPLNDALASITVITRADIDRLQPHSVAELLAGLPGVAVANNGGLGKVTSVFLRGTESDEVLVLIDGIPAGSATTGTTAFEQIPVDQIERIEIVRGPRSSLYGSDAIGGVIQIFTRQGNGPPTPSLSVSGGSYGSWQGQAGVSGGSNRAWYSASVAGLSTDGFSICANGAPTDAGCYSTTPHKNGYWNTSAALRGGYGFDNGAQISADWLRVYGDTQYAGDFINSSKEAQQILGATLKLPAVGPWKSSLQVGQTQDDANNYEQGVYVDAYDTRRNSASWQSDFALAPGQQLTAGLDYLQDEVLSDTAYTVGSRVDVGEFAQYQGGFGPLSSQLSLRNDHDEQFGGHVTGGAALGYAFSSALRSTLSYGSAFKAPSFNDLYFPGYGNPDLKPVSSHSTEVGLIGTQPSWRWSLFAYYTAVNDLITYDAATFAPANLERTLIRGVEAQLGGDWGGWRQQLAVTLLDARDGTPGDDNAQLPRRPRQSARYDLDRQWQHLSVGGSWILAGRTYDDLANTVPLGGYGTLDLRVGYQLSRDWLLQLQLSNLFDKDYESAKYYNQPGRALYLTLRYHPASRS